MYSLRPLLQFFLQQTIYSKREQFWVGPSQFQIWVGPSQFRFFWFINGTFPLQDDMNTPLGCVHVGLTWGICEKGILLYYDQTLSTEVKSYVYLPPKWIDWFINVVVICLVIQVTKIIHLPKITLLLCSLLLSKGTTCLPHRASSTASLSCSFAQLTQLERGRDISNHNSGLPREKTNMSHYLR